MGDEEDEEESDAVVNQVLDELGLQLGDQLTDVPGTGATLTAPAAKGKVPVAAGADVSNLLLCWFFSTFHFNNKTFLYLNFLDIIWFLFLVLFLFYKIDYVWKN